MTAGPTLQAKPEPATPRASLADPSHPLHRLRHLVPPDRRVALEELDTRRLVCDGRVFETWDEAERAARETAGVAGVEAARILGIPSEGEKTAESLATGLQLTAWWLDVGGLAVEHEHFVLPREFIDVEDHEHFEERLVRSKRQGWGVDRALLEESRVAVRECVKRTWPLFEGDEKLVAATPAPSRTLLWRAAIEGRLHLRLIEQWNHETALHRPELGVVRRWWVDVATAWVRRRSRRG